MAGEEARQQLHKNLASNIKQVLAATPHKAPTIHDDDDDDGETEFTNMGVL